MSSPVAFITGGTGLVGSHLLYELLQKGYKVKALKRPLSNTSQVLRTFKLYGTDADADALFRKIEWTEAGLSDFREISEAMEGCNQVYHAAATVSFHNSNRAEMLKTNVDGTVNIINACLEKQLPLCFVSSIGALGRSEDGKPVSENSLWQTSIGRSAYSLSKYKSEMEVWRGIAEGLQANIVNPSVILGPGDWNKGSSSFFSRVYKGMRFYTPGITGFVDVRDVSRCMVLLMEQKKFGERYILSAGDLSYHELFDMVAEGLNVPKPVTEAKAWMLHTARHLSWLAGKLTAREPLLTKETVHSALQQHQYSSEKIKTTLSYEFISLKKSIQDCCRYFLQQHDLLS